MSTQSTPSSKSSNDGVSKESTRTVIPSHSRKRQKVTRSQDPKRLSEIERLKELLLKTDTRLSEDGKSIKCLLCGKSPKLGNCKRSAEGHIEYFNRVHIVALLRLLILKLHKPKSKTSLGQLKSDKKQMQQTQQKF